MTARDRHASGGATLASRPAPVAVRAAPSPVPEVPLWEELYRCLPESGQHDLLALALHQGLLYSHQLPLVDPSVLLQRRQLFAQLLAGKARDLPTPTARAFSCYDDSLDAVQREAVARALATPDISLIQGLPGSGKSRVIAEIVHQATARGERVLLVSATAAGLDRVLEQVGRREGIWALRSLHSGETIEGLSACVRACTTEERTRQLRESTTREAQARSAAIRQQLDTRREQQTDWDRLASLVLQREVIDSSRSNLASRRSRLADETTQAWGTAAFGDSGQECVQRWDQERERVASEKSAVEKQRQAIEQERRPLTDEYESLRPLVEAKREGRWLTLSWWKAVIHGKQLERAAELEKLLADLGQRETALKERLRQLEDELPEIETRFANERQTLIDQEITRRKEQLDREEIEFSARDEAMRMQWDETVRLLPESCRPEGVDGLTKARAEWEQLVEQDAKQADFAHRWAASLEEAAPALIGRLPSYANLVAQTPGSLQTEKTNGDGAILFDLLIIEEADLLSEADLLLAARRARRWVLVGEPDVPLRLSHRGLAPRPGPFSRLWQSLHAAPRRLPFRWSRSDGRLCCRLRPVPSEHHHWIQAEPVADSPEIELHILAVPRQEPVLVEVRFPATMSVDRAKEFIYRELQEVTAHARGPACLWSKERETLCVQMGAVPPNEWRAEERVPLCEGVCEIVRSGEDSAFETLGFEFAPSWPQARAEEWVASQLGLCDSGRTTYLGRVYRSRPGIASFLARALFRDVGLTHTVNCVEDGVKLIPVPAMDPVDPRRKARDTNAVNRTAPRPGAGFEADLAAAPAPERLPSDLRAALPRKGLVNYPEAQAVIQALETLLTDAAFRAEAAAWHGKPCTVSCAHPITESCKNGHAIAHNPTVVVSALYEGQVHLLRLLIARSTTLSGAGLTKIAEGRYRLDTLELVVAPPPALRQRECLALLLSLTRSHSHRAVALGEQASWLPLALTRACGRLSLFGDVGTLTRRTQWQGAVDHLDEMAGERERELAAHLLRCTSGIEPQLSSAVESAGR